MKRFGTVVCFLSLASLLASGAGAATSKPTAGRRAAAAKARAAAIHLNRNLIVNGGAEFSEEGWASGWEPAHALESEGYGHTAGEWDAGVTGAPQAGERYFRLPVPDGQEAIEFGQSVSVAAESAAIDSGLVHFKLSGWFGGVLDGPGSALLSAVFASASGESLGEAATDPVPRADLPRPDVGRAALAERWRAGELPAGTRRIHVRLIGRNLEFASCENCSALGLADKLGLVLSRAPSKP